MNFPVYKTETYLSKCLDSIVNQTYTKLEIILIDDALHLLLMDKTVTNHVWNKLFKKELFEGVLFPYGRTFEDIATTYKLFEKASRIAVLNSGKYHQLQRDDSISCPRNIRKEADICLSTYERCVDLIGRYPEERELLLAGFYLAFANLGYAAARQKKDYFITYKNRLQAISNFAAKNRREVWKCRLVGRACKLSYTLFLRETRLASAGIRFFFLSPGSGGLGFRPGSSRQSSKSFIISSKMKKKRMIQTLNTQCE